MQSQTNRKHACIPGTWYTSAPAYLPDPLSSFSEGLVLRQLLMYQAWMFWNSKQPRQHWWDNPSLEGATSSLLKYTLKFSVESIKSVIVGSNFLFLRSHKEEP